MAADMDPGFDGTVLKAFLRILDTETEGYRKADDHRFVLPGRSGPRDAPKEDVAGAPS